MSAARSESRGRTPFFPPPPPPPVDAGAPPPSPEWVRKFHEDLAVDEAFERTLLTREIWIVLVIVLLVIVREVLL
jgi:hypothetical protein